MTARLTRIEQLPADARQRWAAARVWAAHQAPYLATALLALIPVVVDQSGEPVRRRFDLRAFPTDQRWHVYVDPEVLARIEVPELGFWLLHQATHLLRRHADRFPDRDTAAPPRSPLSGRDLPQLRWNLAGDAEIDDDLRAGEIALPGRAVTPLKLGLPDGWVAEQYWDALTSRGPAVGVPGSGRPDPPATAEPAWLPVDLGPTDPGSTGGPAASPRGSDPPQPQAGRWHEDGGAGGASDCGSGCDGCERPWDCDRPGLGAVDCKLLARDAARRIREHRRRRGDVPAGWQRWADELLEPTVEWRRVLAAAVRRGVADVAGRVDFTYRRLSRRSTVVPQVVLPSLRQPLPHVAVVIDTSGSMSDQMLAQALGEVGGVLRSVGVAARNLHVLCCDARAYEAQRVLDARQVRLLGGGGTDMGAGLAAAEELRPRPDLVIVLTDGHTPWPPEPPAGLRVLVGLMDATGGVPDWASSVRIQPPHATVGW